MRIEPGTNRKLALTARAASCVVALAVVGGFVLVFNRARAADQPVGGNSAKGFYSPLDYFPPPHELQMRSYLEGTESEMGPNGTIILHNAKLQTFHEDGSKEMIMSAPQCVYDYGSHIVHSDGPLKMQMWDENNQHAYQVQGSNGFYWQQTNSLLIVSNQQKTTISGSLTNSFTP
jgi:hypothetical protein